MIARAATQPWKSPAFTGTSSISSGCLSSRSFICGKGNYERRRRLRTRPRENGAWVRRSWRDRRSAAPAAHLFVDLAVAVRFQHLFLPGRLFSAARHAALVADRSVHAGEGGFHRRHLHAHALGAARAEIRDPDPAAGFAGADRAD